MPEIASWLLRVDRITDDLQSLLTDFDPAGDEDWAGWVEMAMNEAWDALGKVDPNA